MSVIIVIQNLYKTMSNSENKHKSWLVDQFRVLADNQAAKSLRELIEENNVYKSILEQIAGEDHHWRIYIIRELIDGEFKEKLKK